MHKTSLFALALVVSACNHGGNPQTASADNADNGGTFGCGGIPHPEAGVKAFGYLADGSGYVVDAIDQLWSAPPNASDGGQTLVADGADAVAQDDERFYTWKAVESADSRVAGPLTIYGAQSFSVAGHILAGTVAWDTRNQRVGLVANVTADGAGGDLAYAGLDGTVHVVVAAQRSDATVHASAGGLVFRHAAAASTAAGVPSNHAQLTLVSGDGSARTLAADVTDFAAADGAPVVIFAVDGSGQLVRIDTVSGETRALVAADGIAAVSPAGDLVAFVPAGQSGSIGIISADGGSARIIDSARRDGDLFSADGKWLLYAGADGLPRAQAIAGGPDHAISAVAGKLIAARDGVVVLSRADGSLGETLSTIDLNVGGPPVALLPDVGAGLYRIARGHGGPATLAWTDPSGNVCTISI